MIKRAMFSATQQPHLNSWCKENLKNLAFVYVGARNSTVNTVKQELLFVGNEAGKLIAFRDLIRKVITVRHLRWTVTPSANFKIVLFFRA